MPGVFSASSFILSRPGWASYKLSGDIPAWCSVRRGGIQARVFTLEYEYIEYRISRIEFISIFRIRTCSQVSSSNFLRRLFFVIINYKVQFFIPAEN